MDVYNAAELVLKKAKAQVFQSTSSTQEQKDAADQALSDLQDTKADIETALVDATTEKDSV